MWKAQIILGFGLAFALAGSVRADTYFVPGHYDSLQYALDGVAVGDTVIVGDGVWTGPANRNLDFGGKDLVLRSQNGASHCTLDAEGTADYGNNQRHFYFHSGETNAAVVEGFTFIGGWRNFHSNGLDGAYGGAILCHLGASPTIRSCVFDGNHGFRGGAIAGITGAAPRLEDCEFLNNQASEESHVQALNGGGAVLLHEPGEVVITGCSFVGNDGIVGGGLYYWEGDGLTVSDCLFESNHAKYGGGLYVRESLCTLERCDFIENQAYWLTGSGGGVSLANCDDLVITECEFRGNRAWYSGGLQISGGRSDVNHCLFIGNEANSRGGGLRWYSYSGDMSDCIFSGNTAHVGGGIYLDYGWPTFTRCTITGNHAVGEGGGLCSEMSLYFYYNILWGNTCDDTERGPQMAIWGGGRVRVDHCVVEGDSTAVYLEEPGHSEYLWGEYNLDVDPQFCSSQYDIDEWWAVQFDSPCVSPYGLIGAVGVECGETPTWLSEFTAFAGAEGVRIDWFLSAPAEDREFRLTGHRGDQTWMVSYETETSGSYSALDDSPAALAGGAITYRLFLWSGQAQWSQVSEKAVTLPVRSDGSHIRAVSPNPFNPSTTISFVVTRPGQFTLTVYDVRGNAVATLADGGFAPGEHRVQWDGRDREGRRLPSGVFMARLVGESAVSRQRMLLVR